MSSTIGTLRGSALGAVLVLMLAVGGCSTGEHASPELRKLRVPTLTAAPSASPVSSADDAVERVVVISVDGLNPTALERLGPVGAPAAHRLVREGAATFEARTLREVTQTLPDHTGMLTGRSAAGPGGHGMLTDGDPGGTVHRLAGGYVASVFDVVHDHGGRTALLTAKNKLALFDRTWSGRHGRPDRDGADDGRDKIDRFLVADERRLVADLERSLADRPATLSILHLAQPDRVGHEQGYLGAAYLDAVRAADTLVGRVVAAIENDPALRGSTAVVLTSDHGGVGTGHGDPARRDNFRVPFIVWGPGVARGADLYDLNRDRRADPGTARTGYAGPQPVRNAEVANLVTDLLDLPQVPDSQFNRDPQLQVSR
jgi:hypothetical protein